MRNIKNWNRRNFLRGLAGVPILRSLGVGGLEIRDRSVLENDILEVLASKNGQEEPALEGMKQSIRLGIIGVGARGSSLLRACGFAGSNWRSQEQETLKYQAYKNQYDLNVTVTAICDVFELHRDRAEEMVLDPLHGSGRLKNAPKKYEHYQDLLSSDQVDAVIIATPDHWHAQMVLDAVESGKHVYCEKCLTRTAEEAVAVFDKVSSSEIVFQLGHQNRQHTSVQLAYKMYQEGALGQVTSIETYSNRNTDHGAWIRHLNKPGDLKTINWKAFLGKASPVPFDIRRFYNWTHYWEYSTGMVGQLFSHEFDIVNQITRLGIPAEVTASGGIYHYQDDRETPDIINAVFNYPKQKKMITYAGNLASGDERNTMFLGNEASMKLGQSLLLTFDRNSKKYADEVQTGHKNKLVSSENEIDAVSGATSSYYQNRGLTLMDLNGRVMDATHLHLFDWLYHIRNGGLTSCNIMEAFQEGITCHMATQSLRENRKVYWDPKDREIV